MTRTPMTSTPVADSPGAMAIARWASLRELPADSPAAAIAAAAPDEIGLADQLPSAADLADPQADASADLEPLTEGCGAACGTKAGYSRLYRRARKQNRPVGCPDCLAAHAGDTQDYRDGLPDDDRRAMSQRHVARWRAEKTRTRAIRPRSDGAGRPPARGHRDPAAPAPRTARVAPADAVAVPSPAEWDDPDSPDHYSDMPELATGPRPVADLTPRPRPADRSERASVARLAYDITDEVTAAGGTMTDVDRSIARFVPAELRSGVRELASGLMDPALASSTARAAELVGC